jgi:hypothetical protein
MASDGGALESLGVSLRDIVEATVALAVIWSQLRSCRKSLKGQGKRLGALETKAERHDARLGAIEGKVLEFRRDPDVR